MAKQLKKFMYRPQWGDFKNKGIYVLATSQKQAVELINEIGCNISLTYLRDYCYKAWGTDGDEALKDVDMTQPCVYSIDLINTHSVDKSATPVKLK